MLTGQHPASPFSPLLLARLICLVSRLTAILTLTLCTSALTVFMATQPLAELLWHRLPGPWSTSRPANAEGTASPSSHGSASNLVSSRVCTNDPSPKECPNQRSHHRYYRRRCHHPFLFFQLHFSPSNLLFYAALVLLLSYVSNASPLNDTGTNSQLHTNSQATVQPLSDITNNYEAQNVSLGPTLLSTSPPTSPPLLIENEAPSVIQEYVCGNIDIRNSASSFSQLRKCTVIEGYMQIVLIDNGTVQDFENLTFPKLREITDYVLLYRIRGLQSLSKLFPNLSVIRGRILMYNYAIVIYEMLHLQDIGLPSLTKIVRGDVRIEKNPNLCFVYTIDWTNIAKNFLINANKDPSACPSCKETCPKVTGSQDDGMMIGDSTDRICWTADICQRTCECSNTNLTCTETGECCPKQCIGGCKGSSKNPMEQVCFTCRHFIYQNKCYETCPPDTYEYFDRRCISKDACYRMSRPDDLIYLKALYVKNDHDGGLRARCQLSCPPGHTESAENHHECVHCGGDCPKVCKSSIVSNIQSAQSLKGCTIINGSLEIFISSGGAQIVKELEANLKDLKEISDYLKIARSFPLITLNFLRNLKIIRGNKLERNAALLVFDNANLQDLWTFPNGTLNGETRIQIPNGRVFFHINPKLCPEKIRNLEKYVHFGMNQSWVEPEVSASTNGDKTACDVSTLSVFLWGIESVVVGITFENYKLKIADYRQLLGYLIYLREAEERNVSIFDGRDACSTNEWTVIEYDDMDNGDPKRNATTSLTYIIPNLKPFTQYAFYMKTYMLSNAKQGAQSRILYFKTKPSTPTQPRNVFAKATKHNELKVKWGPPAEPNGNITHYIVRVTRDQYLVNHRDYCTEGYSTNKDARRMVTTTPKPIIEPIVNVWTNPNSTTNESSTKKDGKQCCACKNEKIKPLDIEQSINFEDAVINAVFIKRSNTFVSSTTTNTTNSDNDIESNVFKVKRRRSTNATSIKRTLGPSSTSTQLSTEVFLESDYLSSTSSTLLSTTAAPNVPQIVRKVEDLEITFTDLEHFSEYTVEVQACQDFDPTAHERNAQPCSMTAIATVRTLSLPGADDIDQESVNVILGNITYVDNYYTRHAIISWDAPLKSNGFIMNYELNYAGLQTDGAKQTYPTHCVSISAYKFHSNGYVLSLPPGNYSIRLRARSLSDYSKWTRPVYIFIEEPANEGYKFVIAIILVGILILIIVIGLIGYKIYITRVKMNYISVNPDYMSTGSTYQCDPKWEIAREKITLIRELGQGSFGMVYEGQIIKDKEELISCAVKTVNEGSSIRERIDFLKEADVMKSFTDCHHVVKLLGIVSKDTPVYVLMEIMPRGDLRKYLRENRPDSEENKDSKPPPLSQLLKMAIEISDGMAYLASKKFVHRDLAARNIMVAEDLTVKIGDFGMTRDIYETDYYRKGGRGLLPVRWMSPESLKDGIFTTYSDVWSYGIVIWEMATLASQPYQGLSNEEVLKFVVDGGCMDRPDNCPDVLWNLMENTWQKKPKARPTFLKIVEMLLEHIDKKPFLYLSYYNQRKNDASAPADTEVAIEGDDEEKEGDSLIPLKPLVTPTGGHSDNDSSSADQLCEEDMNVQFFPLSRGAASQVQLFHDSPGQQLTKGEPNGNTAEDTTKCEEPTERQPAVIQNGDLQDGPNGGSNLLLNNNLSASLANSESHSSSTSNANLDESQEQPVIKPLFGDFDGPKHSQPKEAGIAVAGPKRSLINGHLINTSMV